MISRSSFRFERPRIGIAHQSVMIGDAIGNDIGGQYRLLDRLGFQVTIVCEYPHPAIEERHRVMREITPERVADAFDLILYHHSIEWPLGEQFLERFGGPAIAKYHNITPASFFEPYTRRYFDSCVRGRAQTQRLAGLPSVVHWLADSAFNAAEILALGVGDAKVSVLAPFTRCHELLMATHRAQYDAGHPIEALFVGRRAPNKAHRHLLYTLASFRALFPEQPIRLTIVGNADDELAAYYRELESIEAELGVSASVRWLTHLSDPDLRQVFEESHVYLNLSEHEGFCVPVVEAQAIGLPLVACDATAVLETVGPGQLVAPLPRSREDYDLIAGLVREVAADAALRGRLVATGCRNVYRRFMNDELEYRFLGAVEPWLRQLAG